MEFLKKGGVCGMMIAKGGGIHGVIHSAADFFLDGQL